MIAIIGFKRYMAGAYIFRIIIDKLSYCKKLSSIILPIVNKNLDVGFYYTVLFLSLTISLSVKDRKESLLYFQKNNRVMTKILK